LYVSIIIGSGIRNTTRPSQQQLSFCLRLIQNDCAQMLDENCKKKLTLICLKPITQNQRHWIFDLLCLMNGKASQVAW